MGWVVLETGANYGYPFQQIGWYLKQERIMAIKDIFSEVEEAKQDIDNLGVDDLKRELQDNPDLLLIDLREIQERVDLGTIPGSIHAPRGMLEFWASPASPLLPGLLSGRSPDDSVLRRRRPFSLCNACAAGYGFQGCGTSGSRFRRLAGGRGRD